MVTIPKTISVEIKTTSTWAAFAVYEITIDDVTDNIDHLDSGRYDAACDNI